MKQKDKKKKNYCNLLTTNLNLNSKMKEFLNGIVDNLIGKLMINYKTFQRKY